MLDLSLMLHCEGLLVQLSNQAAFTKGFYPVIINVLISALSSTSALLINYKTFKQTDFGSPGCKYLW